MSGSILMGLRVLFALSLYAFLTWALITIWRDIKQQGELLSARRVPPLSLTIKRHSDKPQTRHFTQPEITIGRDPVCECPIEEETISARHARLSYHHGQWWLEDLNSTNGTLLNDERVLSPTVVISEDQIGCGNVKLVITLAGDLIMPPTQKI